MINLKQKYQKFEFQLRMSLISIGIFTLKIQNIHKTSPKYCFKID